MPLTPAINATVIITAVNIKGSSVTSIFNFVIELNFDFFKGMVRVVDSVQGEFYFGLSTLTAVTYTIAGNTTTVVIS